MKIIISAETYNCLQGFASNPLDPFVTHLPNGLIKAEIAKETFDLIKTKALPEENIDDTINRVMRETGWLKPN